MVSYVERISLGEVVPVVDLLREVMAVMDEHSIDYKISFETGCDDVFVDLFYRIRAYFYVHGAVVKFDERVGYKEVQQLLKKFTQFLWDVFGAKYFERDDDVGDVENAG